MSSGEDKKIPSISLETQIKNAFLMYVSVSLKMKKEKAGIHHSVNNDYRSLLRNCFLPREDRDVMCHVYLYLFSAELGPACNWLRCSSVRFAYSGIIISGRALFRLQLLFIYVPRLVSI